ncbi:hypothetical protein, partial [Neisseria sicca]|uniref:hypothetical protein n=1 Tax=Neisseria sicca TaxID=490 RepID=UPI001C9A20EE
MFVKVRVRRILWEWGKLLVKWFFELMGTEGLVVGEMGWIKGKVLKVERLGNQIMFFMGLIITLESGMMCFGV